MSNLPKGWELVQFDKVCDIRDGTHDSPKYIENGVPFITSKHLTDNGIDFTETNYISEENHIEFSKRSKVDNGDILFGMIGTIGKPVIVNTDFEFSIKNVALLKLSSNELLSNIYVLNLLKSNIIINQFLKLSNGGVQSFIALGMIRKLKIPLPPIEEQKKIADILSTVDKKIAFVEENINATEELKKALMQKLLTEGIGHTEFKDSELGRIPESWEIDILENHIQIISGQSPSNFDLEGQTYKFFKVNQLNFCAKYLFESEYAYDYSSYKNFNKGTIIFPKRGAAIFTNKVRILDTEGYIDTNLMGLVTKKTINNEFLYYWLVSFELSNIADTSSIPQINNKHINPLKIAMPQLDEQILISDILINVDNKLEILKQKKQSFEKLKKGLMQKLLTGEVRV